MARLPTLVEALSREDGRGKATIAHVARRLRDTGHIISSKRGVGGATMTMKDAATLLMGCYADISPHGAPEAVELATKLQPLPPTDLDKDKLTELPTELTFLRKRMSFFDTVTAMLENAPALERWQNQHSDSWELPSQLKGLSAAAYSMLHGPWKFRTAGAPNLPAGSRPIRVLCYAPGYAAEIHVGLQWEQLEGKESPFHAQFIAPDSLRSSLPQARASASITLEFGLPVLLALHRAVLGA